MSEPEAAAVVRQLATAAQLRLDDDELEALAALYSFCSEGIERLAALTDEAEFVPLDFIVVAK